MGKMVQHYLSALPLQFSFVSNRFDLFQVLRAAAECFGWDWFFPVCSKKTENEHFQIHNLKFYWVSDKYAELFRIHLKQGSQTGD